MSEFSVEEVRSQLELLGFHDVPDHVMKQFVHRLKEKQEKEKLAANKQNNNNNINNNNATIEQGQEEDEEEQSFVPLRKSSPYKSSSPNKSPLKSIPPAYIPASIHYNQTTEKNISTEEQLPSANRSNLREEELDAVSGNVRAEDENSELRHSNQFRSSKPQSLFQNSSNNPSTSFSRSHISSLEDDEEEAEMREQENRNRLNIGSMALEKILAERGIPLKQRAVVARALEFYNKSHKSKILKSSASSRELLSVRGTGMNTSRSQANLNNSNALNKTLNTSRSNASIGPLNPTASYLTAHRRYGVGGYRKSDPVAKFNQYQKAWGTSQFLQAHRNKGWQWLGKPRE